MISSRVEYRSTFRDLWLFNCAHQFRSFAYQTFLLVVSATLSYLLTRKIHGVETWIFFTLLLAASMIVYILLALIQFLFNAAFLYSRKDKWLLSDRIIEFNDSDIREQSAFSRSVFSWDGIFKIVVRAGLIAIYVTPRSVLMIPPRAFKDEDERIAFLSAIRKRFAVKN